jgi:hypothetical protein
MPPPIPDEEPVVDTEAVSESAIKKGKMKADEDEPAPRPQQYAYFISRGVELLDSEERMIGKLNAYNNISLHSIFRL